MNSHGVEVLFKAYSHQTTNGWGMFDYLLPANMPGPPPHYHKLMEEVFFVTEGTLRLMAGEKTVDATTGSLVVIPPGTVHTFANKTDQPARFQVWLMPAKHFEGYFDKMEELTKTFTKWPPDDMHPILELMQQHDTYPQGM